MNIYSTFFTELKAYLLENKLQPAEDFIDVTDEEIDAVEAKIGKPIPLAYREWLKLFGRINCLLNYPIEAYHIENLEYCQEELKENPELYKISKEDSGNLLLITEFQGYCIYVIPTEENPRTYYTAWNTPVGELQGGYKFTTHIKYLIIPLINNTIAYYPEKIPSVVLSCDILNRDVLPYGDKEEYKTLLKDIELKEVKEGRIYSIEETILLWNELNKKA